MRILDKLKVDKYFLLTFDGDVLGENADKVVIDGVPYDYEIAYDIKNSIAVQVENIVSDEVDFIK